MVSIILMSFDNVLCIGMWEFWGFSRSLGLYELAIMAEAKADDSE